MCPFFVSGTHSNPPANDSPGAGSTTTPGISTLAQSSLTSNDPDKCTAKNPPTNLGRAFLTRKRNYCITDTNFQNCSLYQARGGS